MFQPRDESPGWFNQLWFKILTEILVTALMWALYHVVRHVLPKKYRVKDRTIHNIIGHLNALFSNFPSSEDSPGDSLAKSRNLFEYWYDYSTSVEHPSRDLYYLVRDSEEDLEIHVDNTFTQLLLPKIDFTGTTVVLQDTEPTSPSRIVRTTFQVAGQSVSLYLVKNVTLLANDGGNYEDTFACPRGFDYMSLVNLLFDVYDNKLYLSATGASRISCSGLDQQTSSKDYVPDEVMFADLIGEIERFRDQGIQRSYLLHGPPGSGKSSFSVELSQRVSGKVVKLDSNFFNNLTSQSARVLIENLDCSVFIVDDIDRIKTNDMSTFLYTLEAVKNYQKLPTLLATCNNIEALDKSVIRPGRFDDIIEFPELSIEERELFLEQLLEKYSLTLTDQQLQTLAEETEGMSRAYLKEYCLQLKIECDFDVLIKKIRTRMKYIGSVEESDTDIMIENLEE